MFVFIKDCLKIRIIIIQNKCRFPGYQHLILVKLLIINDGLSYFVYTDEYCICLLIELTNQPFVYLKNLLDDMRHFI